MNIPVTVLTGFLGAGKTTLLNRILSKKIDRKIAVIVNEFGEIGIDHQLILNADEEIFEMNNGCICCSVRGDLIRILNSLLDKKRDGEIEFDQVIIETTGLADPVSVAQTFLIEVDLASSFYVDSIITIVDGYHVEKQLLQSIEAQKQIAFADVIILNKTDLIDKSSIFDIKIRLNQLNPTFKFIESINCEVEIESLLNINSFHVDEKLKIEPNLLETYHHHHHNDLVNSIFLTTRNPLDLDRFNKWMTYVVKKKGADLYRYKGIINIDEIEEKVIFQGVHFLFAGKAEWKWKDSENRLTEMVFIGKNLDKGWFTKEFENCIVNG
ncbi:CobW family GTP-binding protein [Gottfriedia acidiceleris]|uniref:CobW family GTP-binding protein n=1 Tax=Gottfriedia acidiceleris TaxID=371036 RepID=UPI001F2A3FA8|nr:GTP-binding protein [Gottfriedia acidiceleris]